MANDSSQRSPTGPMTSGCWKVSQENNGLTRSATT
jgi:hypothetical protein